MSVVRQTMMKLRPMQQQLVLKRNINYRKDFGHIISGPPLVKFPFWEKVLLGSCIVAAMYSYPMYVMYIMKDFQHRDAEE